MSLSDILGEEQAEKFIGTFRVGRVGSGKPPPP